MIAKKALAQCLGQPTLIAIAYTIERNKKAYYISLEQANSRNEIMPCLLYFADLVLNAQRYTASWIEFLISKAKPYNRLRRQVNPLQEKVLARLFHEGPKGFIGSLSAEKYIGITCAPRAMATRDLQDLVSKGALLRHGERKYTPYLLNLETN